MKKFPIYLQQDQMDCGPTCVKIIAKYYGRNVPVHKLRRLCQVDSTGVSLLGISEASENIGFRSYGVHLSVEQLDEIQLPCILHWRQHHFVVLYKIHQSNYYYLADPAKGLIKLRKKEFEKNWFAHQETINGISLLLSPTPLFYNQEDDRQDLNWSNIFRYFYSYKKLFLQLILGLVIGTLLQLITPFLTQSIVDIGINTKNLNFVYLILIAQLLLFLGQTSVEFIRSWILLHISTRVNISILTDLLVKLMKLPIEFFEKKTAGDIMQRMSDQQRIEYFLTGSTLNTLFSFLNLFVFSVVLAHYNFTIFSVFLLSTMIYTGWILVFMNHRRQLDYKRFDISSDNQTTIVEMIGSMREIKLNNSEKQKRWKWEAIQARLFKFKVKSLALSQYQQAGSMAINHLKNIIITFLSAKAVIDGDLTLGGMMAVQYIVGMVSSPVELILGFIQSFQDAKISLERINEIYNTNDEEDADYDFSKELPAEKSLIIRNLTFRYWGAGNEPVLESLNLEFPEGKTTAIVGMSGSGKTTILKLMLRFYKPESGTITAGGISLDKFSFKLWRQSCGVVMQDGYIFADTIESNIAVGVDFPDPQKIFEAIRVANLEEFVNEQPFGLKTKIGTAGKGLSQGQRQRILIARAIYKQPQYIFFDEATNALDANNERKIIENLRFFFRKRTVVIVAHRLSTVSNADNIIVLDKGKVVEQGSHADLSKRKGAYYKLVRNQLELGN